jgi:hypothetical protein
MVSIDKPYWFALRENYRRAYKKRYHTEPHVTDDILNDIIYDSSGFNNIEECDEYVLSEMFQYELRRN